jgi:hypothetical protein
MFHVKITPSKEPHISLPLSDDQLTQGFSLLKCNVKLKTGDQRIPTPDKDALLNLSNNSNKHQLKKHQQFLEDITRRCKEQEILDLSDGITKKCSISVFEERQAAMKSLKDVRYYRTDTINVAKPSGDELNHGKHGSSSVEYAADESSRSLALRSPIALLQRSNTYFPSRNTMKTTPRRNATLSESFTRLPVHQMKSVTPTRDKLVPRISHMSRTNDKSKLGRYVNSQKYNTSFGLKSKTVILDSVSLKCVELQHSNMKHW